MLAFLFSPLGKIAGVVGLVVLAIIGFEVWLTAHDHSVLQGYVQRSALDAANAKAAELKRQADASASALQSLNDQIEKQKAVDAQDDAAREKEINDYETKLQAANRRCNLTGDDLSTILRNNKPQSLGHH